MAVPVLGPDADFYCFLHKPGGDDDGVEGPSCHTGRHGLFGGGANACSCQWEK